MTHKKQEHIKNMAKSYVNNKFDGCSFLEKSIALQAYADGLNGFYESHKLLYIHNGCSMPWHICDVNEGEMSFEYFIATESITTLDEFI